jgi:hypothetical protein
MIKTIPYSCQFNRLVERGAFFTSHASADIRSGNIHTFHPSLIENLLVIGDHQGIRKILPARGMP